MGNQGRQAPPDAEESIIFRDHDGVLELAGRYLFAGRVDLMGHAELWERAAAAGNGDRARSGARQVSGYQSGKRIQEFVRLITAATVRLRQHLALSTWHLATLRRCWARK